MRLLYGKGDPDRTIDYCETDMDPGLYPDLHGRVNVILTHPFARDTACVLHRNLAVPAGKDTTLRLTVGHHPDGDWDLVVRADMPELLRQEVGRVTGTNGWLDIAVDLTPYAGRTVLLEICNQPTGWAWEAGYWSRIAVESE
jgi:hypothetical protein